MLSDNRARLRKWLESGEATLHPLTFPQLELWEAAPLDVKDPANNICCTIEVKGLITEDGARVALQRVVEQQEILRLSFLPGKQGPLQLVRKTGEIAFEFRELAAAEAEDVEQAIQQFFTRPFDLVLGPLYRVLVLRRAADDHLILFAIHHAVGDGWSWGIFARELFTAYMQHAIGKDQPLPALPQTYTAWGAADRASWSQDRLEDCRRYWRPRLEQLPRLWNVPVSGDSYATFITEVPEGLSARIRNLAQVCEATPFSTLLAAFQIAFAGWSSTHDVVVGSPYANRRGQLTRDIMGSFAIMIPQRARIDHDRSFREHLVETHHSAMDGIAHAMPFTELAKLSGEPREEGMCPVFEVRFTLQNHPMPKIAFPSLSARIGISWSGTPRFQLACEITENDAALEVVWISNSKLFQPSDIERLDAAFRRVLEAACDDPDAKLSSLS